MTKRNIEERVAHFMARVSFTEDDRLVKVHDRIGISLWGAADLYAKRRGKKAVARFDEKPERVQMED